MKSTDDDFSFSVEPAAPCAGSCPLARIPEPVWKYWLHLPFRKRHPWLYRLGILLLVMLLLLAVAVASDEETFGNDSIAVVSVSGPILDIGSQLDWIRKISDNPRVKGVLLRVDSPGGGAAASQELYTALKGLAATRPVAVSMGSTAASGGVMVAMAGTRIFANASTVTGSIGVRMDIPQLGDPIRERGGLPYFFAGRIPAHHRHKPDRLEQHSQHPSLVAHSRKGDGTDRTSLWSQRHGVDHDRRARGLLRRGRQPFRCRRNPTGHSRGRIHTPAAQPTL